MESELAVPILHHLSRRKLLLLDGMLAVVLLTATVVRIPHPEGHTSLTGTSWDLVRYVAAVFACAPLAARRRWPGPVLVLVTIGNALLLALGSQGPALLGLAFAIYTVAVAAPSPVRLRVVGVVAGVMLAAALVAPGGPEWAVVIAGPAVVLVGWLAGQDARARRAHALELLQQAADREQQREQRMHQAATDERLRIARELHDVVAHSMTVIAVRAGAGRVVLDSQPEEARDALSIIETTSRRALREMRRIVGVLRQPDESDEGDLEPAPRLAQIDDLVDQATQAGVHVDVEISGEVRPLPEGVEVSAYRIVQEALTNVVRHAAPTTAHLRIRFRSGEIEVEVQDDGRAPGQHPAPPTNGSGHGLLGMRERVALYHGGLSAEPAGAGYRVVARLPTDDS